MINKYHKGASINARYLLGNQVFDKRTQYVRIKNLLHKQSVKTCMCFKTRQASTRDYTVTIAILNEFVMDYGFVELLTTKSILNL